MEPMWRTDDIAQIATDALQARAEEFRLEQAVRGLDALPEVGLHPILGGGFRRAGLEVFAEWPYPGEPERRARHSERERCDLVLTTGVRLIDPVQELRERDKAAGTLFDPDFLKSLGAPALPADARDDAKAAAATPGEAYWLEIKTVGQHTYSNGVPGPNHAYAAELIAGPTEDAIKLEWDAAVRHCGVLVVLFTEDERTAEHDLSVLMHRLLDREIPVASHAVRHFGIPDVIGNRVCSVALVPLVKVQREDRD
jgi:hypothetical protein